MSREPTQVQHDRVVKAFEDAITEVVAGNEDHLNLKSEVEARLIELNGSAKRPKNESRKADATLHRLELGEFAVTVDVFLVNNKPTGFGEVVAIEGDDADTGDKGSGEGLNLFGDAGQNGSGETPPATPDVGPVNTGAKPETAAKDVAQPPKEEPPISIEQDRAGDADGNGGAFTFKLVEGFETLITPYAQILADYASGTIKRHDIEGLVDLVDGRLDAPVTTIHSIALKADGEQGNVQLLIAPHRVGKVWYARATTFAA